MLKANTSKMKLQISNNTEVNQVISSRSYKPISVVERPCHRKKWPRKHLFAIEVFRQKTDIEFQASLKPAETVDRPAEEISARTSFSWWFLAFESQVSYFTAISAP